MKVPALIIGLNVAALAIARSLGEKGVKVIVIDDDIKKRHPSKKQKSS